MNGAAYGPLLVHVAASRAILRRCVALRLQGRPVSASTVTGAPEGDANESVLWKAGTPYLVAKLAWKEWEKAKVLREWFGDKLVIEEGIHPR